MTEERAVEPGEIRNLLLPEWRRVFWVVCSVLALSYGYFYAGGGWNQASRFGLVRALVEEKTVRIDSFHGITGDKAEREGHYYCDKAPGVSFLAVPVVAVLAPVLEHTSLGAKSHKGLSVLAFLGTFVASSLPSAAGAAALLWLARRLGAGPLPAALAALSVGLGTPIFAYSILLWGHATAGACLIGALAVGISALTEAVARRRFIKSALFGFLLGMGVLVEYPAGGAGAFIGFTLLHVAYRKGGRRAALELCGAVTLGAALPVILLMLYQKAAFGSAFALSYSKVEGWEGMKEGFFGVSLPKPSVLRKLIDGSRRGVLVLAPCLLMAPVGFYLLRRRVQSLETRAIIGASFGVIGFYFLLNASYHYWDGGYTYGPRHVGPTMPFLGLGIAAAAAYGSYRVRLATLLLGVFSAVLTLMVVTWNPMPPTDVRLAHIEFALPRLVKGDALGDNAGWIVDGEPSPNTNLGALLGLKSGKTMLPVLALWGVAFVLLLRKRSPRFLQMGKACALPAVAGEACERCSQGCMPRL
ncbi:MAG: hypothetical protein QM756_29530 [Polyangiaceae bacterium]